MRWRHGLGLVLVLAVVLAACASDPTSSDEYQALEQELATTQQELAATQQQLADTDEDVRGLLAQLSGTTMKVPDEVNRLLGDWWTALERGDGSVADLYRLSGYHFDGSEKLPRKEIAAHLSAATDTEWITEPYLVAAEPEGRYVVVRGLRISSETTSWASAFIFEIVTTAEGELKLAQTDWVYANGWVTSNS